MANMKLAEALVLRKHLQAKVAQLEPIKLNGDRGIFEVQVSRKNINDTTDEVTAQIPKLTLSDVTAEYDKHAKALRLLETAIQQANWTTELGISEASLLGTPIPVATETTTDTPATTDTATTEG